VLKVPWRKKVLFFSISPAEYMHWQIEDMNFLLFANCTIAQNIFLLTWIKRFPIDLDQPSK